VRKTWKIAVPSGTGAEESGLAYWLAGAGHNVTLGSRDQAKVVKTAAELSSQLGVTIRGTDNLEAASNCEIAILTVPYSGQKATVGDLKIALSGKILIDATVPLVPPKVSRVQLPSKGSAVAAPQKMLGEDVKVVSAFQNVPAHHPKDVRHVIDCNVLICGNDKPSCEIVATLTDEMNLRGIYAGPIGNSVAAEALTSLLITINR
jgi:NADPH-dependent F420 reductase